MNGTIKDNCLYTRDGETLLYSAGKEKILIIPDGVKKIGECAFAHLGAHECVVIPKDGTASRLSLAASCKKIENFL